MSARQEIQNSGQTYLIHHANYFSPCRAAGRGRLKEPVHSYWEHTSNFDSMNFFEKTQAKIQISSGFAPFYQI